MTIHEMLGEDEKTQRPRKVITTVVLPLDMLYDLDNLAAKSGNSRSKLLRAGVRLLLREATSTFATH